MLEPQSSSDKVPDRTLLSSGSRNSSDADTPNDKPSSSSESRTSTMQTSRNSTTDENIAKEHKPSLFDDDNNTGKPLPPSTGLAEQVMQVAESKEEEARAAWCKAYDAAQPTGRSLSSRDAEFQEILRVFRESQSKYSRLAVNGNADIQNGEKREKEKGTLRKWFQRWL